MNDEEEEYNELETSYETLKSFLSSDLLEVIDNPFNESEVTRERQRRRTTEVKRKKRLKIKRVRRKKKTIRKKKITKRKRGVKELNLLIKRKRKNNIS